MTVGVVIPVHNAFDRAEQVIRHWVDGGCPVVVHVDQKVDQKTRDDFVANLADLKRVKFCQRHACEWGTWGIVAGTQSASIKLLAKFPEVRRISRVWVMYAPAPRHRTHSVS